MSFIEIDNNQCIELASIPKLKYELFYETILHLAEDIDNHCVSYFGVPSGGNVTLYCCIANDKNSKIYITSSDINVSEEYPSLTEKKYAFHCFEREIYENYGVKFSNHPWLKPVRYPFDRFEKNNSIDNYPFYSIESEELHEVGVGPVHAGIIEPGHFRFICNGEQIIHLEIQLGYQHRGIESLLINKKNLFQKVLLSENIAGDTVIGHSSAFVNVWESLCNFKPSDKLINERALALEIERIAIHTGDLSAISTDIAYQLGSSVFGRLRTPIINFFQTWCGNRLAKSLIRPGKTNYPFNTGLSDNLNSVLDKYEPDFIEMYDCLSDLPSALSRLEKTGVISKEIASSLGLVGMAAKASGFKRDVRASHPQGWFTTQTHDPVIKRHGDVFSRTQMRKEEIIQSMAYVRNYINNEKHIACEEDKMGTPMPDSFAISLKEGWRGEICHCALTDSEGNLAAYKIKDPSFHNWMALALAVRNNEISDFPICNKSFNLSYCGFDL